MRIAVVEDEWIIAHDLRESLREVGHEVAEPVASYDEAVELVDRFRPATVLVDIVLRGELDGVDLATTLRERFRIPFVFVTSHADPATVERAREARPAGYLVKPFLPEEVYAATAVALMHYDASAAYPTGWAAGGVALSPRRLQRVADHVRSHLGDEIPVQALAEMTGMSVFSFSRLFKAAAGVSPHQYILRARVEEAQRLLRKTSMSVGRIALEVGFQSPSHFTVMFQRHTGLRPVAFRNAQG